jgi:hypothetical protein
MAVVADSFPQFASLKDSFHRWSFGSFDARKDKDLLFQWVSFYDFLQHALKFQVRILLSTQFSFFRMGEHRIVAGLFPAWSTRQ